MCFDTLFKSHAVLFNQPMQQLNKSNLLHLCDHSVNSAAAQWAVSWSFLQRQLQSVICAMATSPCSVELQHGDNLDLSILSHVREIFLAATSDTCTECFEHWLPISEGHVSIHSWGVIEQLLKHIRYASLSETVSCEKYHNRMWV